MTEIDLITNGEQIRRFRRGNALGQAQLGQWIGVSRQTVASWEAGKTIISRPCFIALNLQLGLLEPLMPYPNEHVAARVARGA